MIYEMNSRVVMYIQKKSVRTVLPSSTVVVGVPLILTTSMVTSMMHMMLAVRCRRRELNVQL